MVPADGTQIVFYSGGTNCFQEFAAEFSAAPMVCKNPPPMSPEIGNTIGAAEGVNVCGKCPSSKVGVQNPQKTLVSPVSRKST